MHRFIGCLAGGLVALACLALSITAFLPWLAILSIAMWVCMHVQTSRRGVGYVSTQAAIVFIVTLVQSAGPPSSLIPGVDRFAGITGGLAILLIATLSGIDAILYYALDDLRRGRLRRDLWTDPSQRSASARSMCSPPSSPWR